MLQEAEPLPGPKSGLLSNTRKWIVQWDTRTDKARDFFGKVPRWSGEGDGTPLQYPCLENPMDRGAR